MSISPNVPTPQESYHYENTGTPRWIAVLFGVLIVAVLGLGYMGHAAQSQMQTDLSKAQDQNRVLSAQLEQANARLADLKGTVEVTQQKVGLTQAELARARSRAETIQKEQLASDQKLHTVDRRAAGKRAENRRSGYRPWRREEGYRRYQNRSGSDQGQA